MKRMLTVLMVLVLAVAAAGAAPKKQANGIHPGLFELGAYLGQPSGISAKYWINGKNSIDGVAAWGFGAAGSGNLVVAADYLFNFIDMVKIEKEIVPPVRRGRGDHEHRHGGRHLAGSPGSPRRVLHLPRDPAGDLARRSFRACTCSPPRRSP